MKKLRIIAFLLVTVICGAVFLTACKKQDDSPVATVEDVKSHYGEVAEIALASQNLTEDSEDNYDQLKELTQVEIDSFINQNAGQFFNDFVTEVLAQSNIKNRYFTDYLKAVKGYVTAKNNLCQRVKNLLEKYNEKRTQLEGEQNKTPQQTEQMQNYKLVAEICNKIYLTTKFDYDGIESVFSLIGKAPFSLTFTGEGVSYQAEISAVRNRLESGDALYITEAFKTLYSAEKKLVKTFDLTAYFKLLINLVLNQEVLDDAVLLLEEFFAVDRQLIANSVQTLKTDYKLENQDKKQAYVDSVSILLDNLYRLSFNSAYALDYDQLVEVIEAYADGKEDKLFGQAEVCLGKVAQTVCDLSLTKKEVQSFTDNCCVVDRNGVGFFAEKYFSLFASVQDFVGQFLGELQAEEIFALTKLLLLEEQTYNANEQQLSYFGLTLFSKIIAEAYEGWDNSDEFLSAWGVAFGKENVSLVTGTISTFGSVADFYPSNGVEVLNSLISGGSYFTNQQTEQIKSDLGFLLLLWKASDFITDEIKTASSAVEEYIAPALDVIKAFLGEDGINQIKNKIPSADVFYEYLNQILEGFI